MRSLFIVVAVCTSTWALAEQPAAEGELYEVSTAGSTTRLKAGETGKVVITIRALQGGHVSDEAPLKIELSSKQSTLTKQKLTLQDSLRPKAEGDTAVPDPRFEVEFTPTAQGSTTVEAKMTFFICSQKQCARQSRTLSVPVEVM